MKTTICALDKWDKRIDRYSGDTETVILEVADALRAAQTEDARRACARVYVTSVRWGANHVLEIETATNMNTGD